MLAQFYAMAIPVVELDHRQLTKLASTARLIKANFNPDQPRDALGRWTDEGGVGTGRPAGSSPETTPQPGGAIVAPAGSDAALTHWQLITNAKTRL